MKSPLLLTYLAAGCLSMANAATFCNLSTAQCDESARIIYDGKGNFAVQSGAETSTELTINLSSFLSYTRSNDYKIGNPLLLWDADVADYATEKNGTSSTGLIFSSGTMAQKLGGAISGSLIALLLGMAGLVSETNVLTGETIVTITNEESVRTMVWSLFSLFPAAIALCMGILAYKFPIKK